MSKPTGETMQSYKINTIMATVLSVGLAAGIPYGISLHTKHNAKSAVATSYAADLALARKIVLAKAAFAENCAWRNR